MLEFIFITAFLVQFTKQLFVKFEVLDKLQFWSSKQKTKFFLELFNCEFCYTFHLSWILSVLVMFLDSISMLILLLPFCVTGLIFTINKYKE